MTPRVPTDPIPAGSRVLVYELFLSHERTCAAQDLIGKTGIVERLIARGGSTYALVHMDVEIRYYAGQAKWPFHVGDLVLVSSPREAHPETGPADYTVGFSAYPTGPRAMRGVRHAVPISKADRPLADAVCRIVVRPIHSPTLHIPFDRTSTISCPACVEGIDLRHPTAEIGSATSTRRPLEATKP